jgi:predicted phage terminase large subunit-like protein
MATLIAKPHRVQRAFLNDPARVRLFVGGIGSGKTWAGALEVVRQPGGTRVMVVAPTYRVLKDATLPAFMEAARPLVRSHRRAELVTELVNGTEILWRTATEPDRLRGPNLGAVWIDEAAMIKTADAFEVLVGRLRLDPGRLWATTTPKGFNWLHDLAQDPKTGVHHASTRDNAALPDDFADFVADRYTTDLAEQELEGRFVDLSGGLFKRAWLPIVAGALPEPASGKRYRFWDLAVSTKTSADYTATARVTVTTDARIVIDGIWQGRAAWPEVKRRIVDTARSEPDTIVGVETIAGFEVAFAELVEMPALVACGLRSIKPSRDKATRAAPLAARGEQGKVWIMPGPHSEALVGQAVTFPHGAHDDLVDAAAGALGMTVGSIGQRIRVQSATDRRRSRRSVEW